MCIHSICICYVCTVPLSASVNTVVSVVCVQYLYLRYCIQYLYLSVYIVSVSVQFLYLRNCAQCDVSVTARAWRDPVDALLYSTALYFNVLYCTLLYCYILYCIVLSVTYCTVLYCSVLYLSVMQSVSTVHYSAVQYSTVRYSAVQYGNVTRSCQFAASSGSVNVSTVVLQAFCLVQGSV